MLEFANEEPIDLIIIGSTRLEGLSRIKALGSVLRNIIENSQCPVFEIDAFPAIYNKRTNKHLIQVN